MPDKKLDPNAQYEQLKNLTNAGEKQLLNMDEPDEFKVHIRPDKNIAPGKFKPHPFMDGHYVAHPTTIRAMRKDIFVGGEGFEDLELLLKCESCKNIIDIQFWYFCPYCEKQFPKEVGT